MNIATFCGALPISITLGRPRGSFVANIRGRRRACGLSKACIENGLRLADWRADSGVGHFWRKRGPNVAILLLPCGIPSANTLSVRLRAERQDDRCPTI